MIDHANTSGLFDGPEGGMVVAYTRAARDRQTQEIATSIDGGRTFRPYAGNPVLDIGSDQFRDPKVLWHAATSRWTMAVVRSREHRVAFYASPDLRHWTQTGSFDRAGLLGIDYSQPRAAPWRCSGSASRRC